MFCLNLLLLLSAFLTALTGAITGVRPVQGVAAEAQVGGVVRAVAVAAVRVPLPVRFATAGWPASARLPVELRAISITPDVPVFGQRRRV